jgi:Zn-dependent protease with chaperone function
VNFFAAQDQARRASRRLVVAYALATALIVAGITCVVGFALYSFTDLRYAYTASQFVGNNAGILIATALLTTLVILGGSMFKTAALSSGGGAVARQMGGTLISPDVQDPLRRRLRNVVEEMAIASGVPVPEIYVLEQESGINAFAAGLEPNNAAVAVTRGAL